MDQGACRIVVADLQPIAIAGIRAIAERTEDLFVMEAVESLPAAMEAIGRSSPSILMVDRAFGLPAIMQLIAELSASEFKPAVVVWGASITEAEVVRLVRAGVSGIARKSDGLDDIVECLRTVAAGLTSVPGMTSSRPEGMGPRLTPREQQVVDMVQRGMRNREIAAELGMRPGTVKVHLKHIFEKTGIRGRYGLALSSLRTKARGARACA